jgi:SAM-dependent methyltransferase
MQGADISPAMLDVARDREVEGDLLLNDLGHGLPLRAGAFDGAISISAVQWLCNAVRSRAARQAPAAAQQRGGRVAGRGGCPRQHRTQVQGETVAVACG